jgi:hypothetical protein
MSVAFGVGSGLADIAATGSFALAASIGYRK